MGPKTRVLLDVRRGPAGGLAAVVTDYFYLLLCQERWELIWAHGGAPLLISLLKLSNPAARHATIKSARRLLPACADRE